VASCFDAVISKARRGVLDGTRRTVGTGMWPSGGYGQEESAQGLQRGHAGDHAVHVLSPRHRHRAGEVVLPQVQRLRVGTDICSGRQTRSTNTGRKERLLHFYEASNASLM